MIKINATFILTVLNFLLLIGVLATILWKPMVKFLDERAQKIRESLQLAENNKKREQEIKIEHDEIIKQAREKAQSIVDKAVGTASDESRELLVKAREKAQATVDAAKEEILLEAEQIKRDLRKDVAAMTVSLTEKVLAREIKEADHRELITKGLDALG